MYRIYDTNNKTWRSDMAMLPDGALCVMKKKFPFQRYKVHVLLNEEGYVVHDYAGAISKNGYYIMEGDICTCPNDSTGVVAYDSQAGGYCIFDENNSIYYVLTEEVGNQTNVIGNVFDGVTIDVEKEEKSGDVKNEDS